MVSMGMSDVGQSGPASRAQLWPARSRPSCQASTIARGRGRSPGGVVVAGASRLTFASWYMPPISPSRRPRAHHSSRSFRCACKWTDVFVISIGGLLNHPEWFEEHRSAGAAFSCLLGQLRVWMESEEPQ